MNYLLVLTGHGYAYWEGPMPTVMEFKITKDRSKATTFNSLDVATQYARSISTLTEYEVSAEEFLWCQEVYF